MAEQIALHLVDPQHAQDIELRLRLHLFHHDRRADRTTQLDDADQQLTGERTFGDRLNEAAVDLDQVEPDMFEVSDRGKAGAEIVQRHADAERLQFGDGPSRHLQVPQQRGFGDFDDQAIEWEAVAFAGGGDHGAQMRPDLARGDVERQREVRRPLRRLGERAGEEMVGEMRRDACPVRDCEQLVRRHVAQVRVLPAHQRLVGDDLAAAGADDGLEMHVELRERGRILIGGFDDAAPIALLLQTDVKGIGLRLLQRLALVQREIGAMHQVDRIAGPDIARRQADRSARLDHVVADRDRLVEDCRDPLRGLCDLGRVGGGQQHGELVTAQPRAQRLGRHMLCQPVRYASQQDVADAMAQSVVDRLEPVEVHQHDGGVQPFAGRPLCFVQPGEEGAAVGEAGQLVVEGEVGNLALALDRRGMRLHDVVELLVLALHPGEQQHGDDRQVRRRRHQRRIACRDHRDDHRDRSRPDHGISGAGQRDHADRAGDRRQRRKERDEGGDVRAAGIEHPGAPRGQAQAEQQRGADRRGEHPPCRRRTGIMHAPPFQDADHAGACEDA